VAESRPARPTLPARASALPGSSAPGGGGGAGGGTETRVAKKDDVRVDEALERVESVRWWWSATGSGSESWVRGGGSVVKLVDGLRRRSGLVPAPAANEPRPDRDGGGEGSSLSVRNECEDETDPAEYCETFSDDRAGLLGGAKADVVGDIPCDCAGGS
jgi:hypothetical protein